MKDIQFTGIRIPVFQPIEIKKRFNINIIVCRKKGGGGYGSTKRMFQNQYNQSDRRPEFERMT